MTPQLRDESGHRGLHYCLAKRHTTTFDTNSTQTPANSTPTPANSMSTIFGFLFFFISCFDIHTRFTPLIRCHHQWALHLDSELSLDLQAHCSAILVSRLLTLLLRNIGRHRSHCWILQSSLLESSRTWEYHSRDMSHKEVLLFFARDPCSCSAAQHFVCIRESPIQRSGQTTFIVSLEIDKLHHLGSSRGNFQLLFLLDQSSMGMC